MIHSSNIVVLALCSFLVVGGNIEAKKANTTLAQKKRPKEKVDHSKKPVVPKDSKTEAPVVTSEPKRGNTQMSRIGLAVELHNENSFLSATRDFDGATVDRSDDYQAGFTSLRAWYHRPISQTWGWTGGLVYRGNYKGPDEYVFGQLLDTFAEFEGRFSLYKSWKLRIAGQGGLSMLIPTKDFKTEVDRLNADGLGVFSGPRIGWFVGGSAGVTFPLTSNLNFFSTLGVNWGRIYLFRSKKTVDNINVNNKWTAEISRRSLDLGIEVSF